MNDDAKRIVDIVISRDLGGVEGANFSTPLFVGKTTGVDAEIGSYSSAKEVSTKYGATSAEYYASVAHFKIVGASQTFKILRPKTGDSLVTALTDLLNTDNQWYGVAIEDLSSASIINDIASWCELNGKFLFTGDNETLHASVISAVDTTSIPALLNTSSRKKSHCLYNKNLRESSANEAGYADVSYMSMVLSKIIGTYTASFKTLSGMFPDTLSTTIIGILKAKNTSWYTTMYGRNITEGSRTCGGVESDWLDVEIGIDWLGSRLQESVISTIFNSDKVAYTDAGAGIIADAVDIILKQAVGVSFLSDYELNIQPVSKQTSSDRNNRIFNGISFTSNLAGAIHKTTIRGKVA